MNVLRFCRYTWEDACIPADLVTKLTQRSGNPDVSRRELEVLRLVMIGTGNKDIAKKLGISERTVREHISNILTKLGVRDRTQAVIIALKRGLITLAS
jgi:two-component system NarL family response regulator